MVVKLEVKKRGASAKTVRSEGAVPGVVYGPKQDPIAVSIDKMTFDKTLYEAGESTIINLVGLGEDIEVLVQDVSFNAAKGGVDHVDFYAIERGKELTTTVALEFVGEAPVTKTGASVTRAVQELEVTCRPSDLPSHITVDISSLVDEESQIKISDISIPDGVTLSVDEDTVLVTVSAVREEEPETEPEEVDMDAVAVEAKGKEEGEEEEKAAE